MASASNEDIHLELEEEHLFPLYPTLAHITRLMSPSSGLATTLKAALVRHCLTRACIFGDIAVLRHIIQDNNCQPYVDLNMQDDDGLALITIAIVNFGNDSDRDIEREECVRLLTAEGADVNLVDDAGWTPLHHAALFASPTLISYLITHGCSPLTLTNRKLTAFDIVTAYSVVPGREDVASLLEEAMRAEGWQSSRVIQQRRDLDMKAKQAETDRIVKENVDTILELDGRWWSNDNEEFVFVEPSDDGTEADDNLYTPLPDYTSMLVYSPSSLAQILDSIITKFRPCMRNADPANALYMLTRFASLTCDETWLEDLIIRATDAIENAIFSHPDDLTTLIFWMYNSTIWLHLLRCDAITNEICESLESFTLIEEVIGSIFVFLIRFAERRVDKLLDSALLDYSPLPSESDSAQFESDWSFFRSPFSGRKKAAASQPVTPPVTLASGRSSPSKQSRPLSPTMFQPGSSPTTSKSFPSLSNTLSRARAHSSTGQLRNGSSASHTPDSLISFLSALHTLLSVSGVNPVFIMQLWSQTMYWTSCEIFNRVLTRKRYLCRSRALQIGMNLSVLEEWIRETGLPRAVESHFTPVREMLHWLQCLSSMTDFSDIVATIQTLKHLNPLQMRRAMRDYRYEVRESRMDEDCSQYLLQLQKDWERQRVTLGVQAFRKEIGGEREQEDASSIADDPPSTVNSSLTLIEISSEQKSLDLLFDRTRDKSEWTPAQPPGALGELLDSRYMFPLLFPSDPRMLSATAVESLHGHRRRSNGLLEVPGQSASGISQGNSHGRGSMEWSSRDRKLRDVPMHILQRVT